MKRTTPAVIAIVSTLLLALGCGRTVPNRDPVGESFPSVTGTALDGETWHLPADVEGERAILLIGYVQDAQFDIDRWLIGFTMTDVGATILEIPTIEGLVPGLISERIDEGMRAGIPRRVWEAVVTVYDDAEALVDFTGNENPRNARVLLLDRNGTVMWFHDAGFSAPDLMEVVGLLPADLVGDTKSGAD